MVDRPVILRARILRELADRHPKGMTAGQINQYVRQTQVPASVIHATRIAVARITRWLGSRDGSVEPGPGPGDPGHQARPDPMNLPVHAVIGPSNPRYNRWVHGFGADCVPITASEPELVQFSDDHRPPSLVYFVDLDRVHPDRVRYLARLLAEGWGADPEEALAEIREHGLPVLADGLVVCVDPAEGRARLWAEAGLMPMAREGGGA